MTWSDAKGGDLSLVVLPVSPASSSAQCFMYSFLTQIENSAASNITQQTTHGGSSVVQTFKIPSTASSPYTLKNFLLPAGAEFVAALWDEEGGYADSVPTGTMSES